MAQDSEPSKPIAQPVYITPGAVRVPHDTFQTKLQAHHSCGMRRRVRAYLIALLLAPVVALACLHTSDYQNNTYVRRWLQVASWSQLAAARYAATNDMPTVPASLQQCLTTFSEFLPNIYEDLMPWQTSGISEKMMDYTHETEGYYIGAPGLPIVIKSGQVYVIDKSDLKLLMPWHAKEVVIYAHVLKHLEQMYGKELPDTEFLIRTNDETEHDMVSTLNGRRFNAAPVFR